MAGSGVLHELAFKFAVVLLSIAPPHPTPVADNAGTTLIASQAAGCSCCSSLRQCRLSRVVASTVPNLLISCNASNK